MSSTENGLLVLVLAITASRMLRIIDISSCCAAILCYRATIHSCYAPTCTINELAAVV
jgi:hypothetical protein